MMIDNISQLNSMTSLQIDSQIQGYLIILTKKSCEGCSGDFLSKTLKRLHSAAHFATGHGELGLKIMSRKFQK